jgi:hypothetical protein
MVSSSQSGRNSEGKEEMANKKENIHTASSNLTLFENVVFVEMEW